MAKKKNSETSVKKQPNSKKVQARRQDTTPKSLIIVGIGASAGGLEAFEAFFTAMPNGAGMAFVLVAHLDPGHVSILPELIQKRTEMKVVQVTDNLKILPNHVYVIPPNSEMAILNGHLQLFELQRPRGMNLPIDVFFRSLAQDNGSKACCIILSGTGTDGTIGARQIKGEAGLVMVQEPESAKYDGMPRSAISNGLADFILPPHKMPEKLISYVRHFSKKAEVSEKIKDEKAIPALQKIYLLLRNETNHDFSSYKKNTICRRIERRMHVHQVENIDDYVRYLQDSKREVSILFREMLIGVTNFFRDKEAFEVLKNIYLPSYLKEKPDDYSVRVWVPGCSSGEEAYSVAIILQEVIEGLKRNFNVQVFGTDIDDEAIDKARAGIYPDSISADVDQNRLKKFFAKDEDCYKIKKIIREKVVFAPQNIIKDPPFTKLDLLCCRNLLIYLGADLQKKLFPIFHYSLRQEGLLFLGSSETIGQSTDLFKVEDKKWKLFKRLPTERAAQQVLDFPTPPLPVDMPAIDILKPARKVKEGNILQLLKTILQQSDLPACVIIDDTANIIYVHGRTGQFLEPAEGETSVNILEMARAGLKPGLTKAIRKVATDRQETVVKNLRVKVNGGYNNMSLTVRPIPDYETGFKGLMMVIFDETSSSEEQAVKKAKPTKKTKKSDEVIRLEDELQYSKENLQTTIEELETSNEELKSTNEELQSTNEELQSTNEELETSKEELQSLNEESATVNVELQSRIDELSKANDDIKNLLDAIQIATIFLDIDLLVRRFTPGMTNLIPLTAIDIGRPISHFSSKLKGLSIVDKAKGVLDDLVMREQEVEDESGNTYRMRVRPYRTVNNVIDGVVVTFEDITELKGIENRLLQSNNIRRLATVVADSNDAITLHDLDGNIIEWNKGAKKIYGYSESEAVKMNIMKLVPSEEIENYQTFLTNIRNKEVNSFRTKRQTKDGKILDIWLTATRLPVENSNDLLIATTERDMAGLDKE